MQNQPFVIIGKDLTRKFNIRVIPEFKIELHDRDLEVLKKKVRFFFGLGSIKKK